MKKIFITILSVAVLFAGCSKINSLLDTSDYTSYNTGNFPKNEKDAEQVVTGIYYTLPKLYTDPVNTVLVRNTIASDDMFGGGSSTSTDVQGIDRYMDEDADSGEGTFKTCYNGIFRANFALESIPNIPDEEFSSVKTKNYLIGQAYFLRAWFNWMLAEYYENIPLIQTTATSDDEAAYVNAPVEDIYTLIADDLTKAIELMPAEYGYSRDAGRSGRATKYAAESVLARIWMFYTGFYKKDSLPLPDGKSITKSQIISYLEDVRDNSKFGLVNDPREIWPCTNDYSSGFAYGKDFGTYAAKHNLHWVGDRCQETIWGCHFSNVNSANNRVPEYYGLRNSASTQDEKCYPYGIGYTKGIVNPRFVEDWYLDPDYGPDDIRIWGSVMAVDNVADFYDWLNPEDVELPKHPGNPKKEFERTYFHPKKYMVVTSYSDGSKSSLYKNFYYSVSQSNSNSNQHSKSDIIYVRYADVLLMLDELKQTVTGMNQLRVRAGLKPYDSYSFEKLQKERRYELCFEGTRWTDLRRWYPEDAAKIVYNNQVGAFITYTGKVIKDGWQQDPNRTNESRYQKTRGFWMIPQTQITLSNGKLIQNPGWGEEDNWMLGAAELPYTYENGKSVY